MVYNAWLATAYAVALVVTFGSGDHQSVPALRISIPERQACLDLEYPGIARRMNVLEMSERNLFEYGIGLLFPIVSTQHIFHIMLKASPADLQANADFNEVQFESLE